MDLVKKPTATFEIDKLQCQEMRCSSTASGHRTAVFDPSANFFGSKLLRRGECTPLTRSYHGQPVRCQGFTFKSLGFCLSRVSAVL